MCRQFDAYCTRSLNLPYCPLSRSFHHNNRYFQQNKLTSFQRQLNLYGFNRLTRGVDSAGYYHEHFLRDREYLAKRMMRQRIKGTKIKGAASPEAEPDFYAMPPVMATLQEQAQQVSSSSSSSFDDNHADDMEPQTALSLEHPVVSSDDMSSSYHEESSDEDDDSHHHQQQVEHVPSFVPSMTDYTPQQGLMEGMPTHDVDEDEMFFADPADALLMDLQSIDPLEDFGLVVPMIRKDQALGEMLHSVLDASLAV